MYDRSIRDIIREEKGKLAVLSWKQRLGYIWDYYKPLMVAILVVILCIYIGVTSYRNLQIDHILNVYLINCNSWSVDGDQMAEEFAEYLGGIGPKEEITFDASLALDETDNSQAAVAAQMKMVAVAAAGDMDVVLFDQDNFRRYCENGGLRELTELLSPEQLQDWEAYLVEGTVAETGETGGTGEAGVTGIYGIRVEDSEFLKRHGAYGDGETPVYATVIASSERGDMSVAFLEFLMEGL